MGQVFVSELSYLYENCKIYDLQHGILYPQHESLKSLIKFSNFNILFYGDFYVDNISSFTNYSAKKMVSIGHPFYTKTDLNLKHRSIILLTSSIANEDFYAKNNFDLNEIILLEDKLINTCLKFSKFDNYEFYFKPHPRLDKKILARFSNLKKSGVNIYYGNYNSIMKRIFINISIASTSIIDFSAFGIPSYVALKDCSVNKKYNEDIFFKFYKYPMDYNNELEGLLNKYSNEENTYINDSNKVYEWYWKTHKEYDHTKFLDIIYKK
tara:strand:+ start:140 stop:940 length:801 start_codon:yes stop_codon:yes gene_type:complete